MPRLFGVWFWFTSSWVEVRHSLPVQLKQLWLSPHLQTHSQLSAANVGLGSSRISIPFEPSSLLPEFSTSVGITTLAATTRAEVSKALQGMKANVLVLESGSKEQESRTGVRGGGGRAGARRREVAHLAFEAIICMPCSCRSSQSSLLSSCNLHA